MALTFSNSELYGNLFGDPELTELVDEKAAIAGMIRFERALARVQGGLGVIPALSGQAIDAALKDLAVSSKTLAPGVAATGVAVPALVTELRKHLPSEHGQFLHWGATSQDVIDTAHVICWDTATRLLASRLATLLDILEDQSRAQARTVMAGRTRSQIATPITFGLRIAQWAAPMIEAETGLRPMRNALLKIQFGGASGGNTALAPNGPAIAAGLAQELGLRSAPPWHTNRTGPLALVNWLGGLAIALDKMATDLMVMSRSEIQEARAGQGGGSSTMPQKANPVSAEALSVLCHIARSAQAAFSMAKAHAEERDGVAWTLEWTLIPQMLWAIGAALAHATTLARTVQADPDRMAAQLTTNSGAMAEAASFILADTMPRAEAQALVKQIAASGAPLIEALEKNVPGIDWRAQLHPDAAIAPCTQIAEQVFATRRSPGI
ncbi:MAG: adenylosuccinate lyase family protein [Rhodobacteraceae bacterium]|nr:adenylosuccinate lyase family protein [Paracoccaceae bacterium]